MASVPSVAAGELETGDRIVGMPDYVEIDAAFRSPDDEREALLATGRRAFTAS